MKDTTMQGRTCLITGATSGIGLATARLLAARGAQIVMVGRDLARTQAAREEIIEHSGNEQVDFLLADLGSLAQVRKLAAEFRTRFSALHVLINNAGLVTAQRELTEDGFERMFGVNHLAHFLLTLELLPVLRRHAPSRVVLVSSDAHRFGRLDADDLQSERGFGFPTLVSAMRVYGGSKLANLLFGQALSRRLDGTGVTVNSVHPGAVATNMGKNNQGWYSFLPKLISPFFSTPEQGATASLYVASSPGLEGRSGAYFVREQEVTPSARARDSQFAEQLFHRSCEMVGHTGDIEA